MDVQTLESVANEMITPGKGLLAADESTGTVTKRLDAAGIESTEETRRQYREMLFGTEGIGEFISGVILYDETIRQSADDGTPLPELIRSQGMIPGIKVDKSLVPFPFSPEETFTQGLDNLQGRLEEYRDEFGARFCKWRATFTISESTPTKKAIDANCRNMAVYATMCQEADLVPIVEPEVLIDGDHTIERYAEVSEWVLKTQFQHLYEHGVRPEGMLLKPNMVTSGKDAQEQAGPEEVARYTIQTMRRSVPAAVPGIVFLSGGQDDVGATEHLNVMNTMYDNLPWEISFSWARALQNRPMQIWGGEPENVEEARKAFYHRARMSGLARQGQWSQDYEEEAA
ncbi:MAG: fructose-bisphosphate aldolase class I [Actinomycetota bacterium]|nr:fructose-bisphosphate aldolase class I [Actinomycetota bacterium]